MKNRTQNVVQKLFPDPFLKIKIEHIPGSKFYSFIQFTFIVWQVENYWNILKLNCTPLAFTWNKPFLQKRIELVSVHMELVSLPHAWCLRKIFPLVCFITWPNFIIWLSFYYPGCLEILSNTCIVIACWPGSDVFILKLTLSL